MGGLRNNIPRIRIVDIARLAGVSAGTVDRVLHNRGEVSRATREKILGIIEEMDYQPDILASTLAARKTIRFAALLPRGTDDSPFWRYPLSGIEEGLREIAHFGVEADSYFFDHASREEFLSIGRHMLSGNYHGMIMAPVFTEEAAVLLEECAQAGVQVVLVNADICRGSCVSFVGQDSGQSGVVAARLMHFGLGNESRLMVVNFTREKGNRDHILKREEGFRKYYGNVLPGVSDKLLHLNIPETGGSDTESILERAIFSSPGGIKGIFVTNSRVFRVARFIEKMGAEDIVLIGYDLLDENKEFLRKGTIDFLISQKPREQGYRSIMTLYRHLVLRQDVERSQYLPVDIITRENLEHYTYT